MNDGFALRPLQDSDAPAILDAFASHADMARQGDVTTLDQAREYVSSMRSDGDVGTAIVTPEGRLIGLVGISVNSANRSGWFFYWLHAQWRSRSIMSRAATAVANRALTSDDDGGWGLERLELGYRVNNPASGRVAATAGFVIEGIEREKFLIDGRRIDVITCGRLVTDPWPTGPELPWLTA